MTMPPEYSAGYRTPFRPKYNPADVRTDPFAHSDGSRECRPGRGVEPQPTFLDTVVVSPSLPDDADTRNSYPMADGLLDYFPNALAEVSRLSYAATKQHHPDKPMHWDRGKSTDHRNKILRHLIDTGKFDDKGMRHSTMVAWRALALLQEELEAETGAPLPRGARAPDTGETK